MDCITNQSRAINAACDGVMMTIDIPTSTQVLHYGEKIYCLSPHIARKRKPGTRVPDYSDKPYEDTR